MNFAYLAINQLKRETDKLKLYTLITNAAYFTNKYRFSVQEIRLPVVFTCSIKRKARYYGALSCNKPIMASHLLTFTNAFLPQS